jgi:hypothetical protein
MDAVAFRCDPVGGRGAIEGVARIEDAGLVLQYQAFDAVHGVLRPGAFTATIAFPSLTAVRYQGGLLGLRPSIELQVADLDAVAAIPCPEAGRLLLLCSFGDRRAASALVKLLDGRRAEARLRHFESELDRMAAPTVKVEPPPGIANPRKPE